MTTLPGEGTFVVLISDLFVYGYQCIQKLVQFVAGILLTAGVCVQIMIMTREQHGCRYLQRQIDEGGNEALQLVFVEILEHVASLMMDPFGNYLVQKVLDACHAEQRMQLLKQIAASDLVSVALNTHGTRAVQKLIEQVQCSASFFKIK